VRRAPIVAGLPSGSWCAQCSVVRRVADAGRTTIIKDAPAGGWLPRSPPTSAIEARLAAFDRRDNATVTTFDRRFTAQRPRRCGLHLHHGGVDVATV